MTIESIHLGSTMNDANARARSQAASLVGSSSNDRYETVRRAAEELVATAFVQPMFKMMREDPLRSDLLPVSAGEKSFGPLLDAELAKRITRSARFDLVDSVARDLLGHPQALTRGAIPAPPPATTSSGVNLYA
ncbi:MAG: hypothetical protein ACF8PN_02480 [Phycisphaerales bacterium]